MVFLGGSCNPTTWRKDIAIPFLTQHRITFYNPVCALVTFNVFHIPIFTVAEFSAVTWDDAVFYGMTILMHASLQQVDNWTPELVDIEAAAKAVRQSL